MASNAFILAPELPTPFPNTAALWTCPITGLKVPKDPARNLAWRADLLRQAENDEGLQIDLLTASAQSILFWINTFGFTFRIQETDEAGVQRQARNQHLPMVTWAIQDEHILEIEKAINEGYDLLTDKTRDMGASWNHIFTFHHQWLFKPDRLFLEMSRVETDVDGADNPRCLFVKHDYINRWLPGWMLPRIDRTRMHIVNKDNNSRIDGESSNKAAGSGDRRHAVLMDEFSKMENAEKIKAATADVTPCRLPNSTPWGPGTTYSKWRMSGQIKVFVMPWWEHPEKGLNRYVKQDESTGKWQIRSPWYDLQAEKRTPREMAQEIDMDHIGSGDTFFEAHVIEQHKRMFGSNPTCFRSIDFKKSVATAEIPQIIMQKNLRMLQIQGNGGPLRMWGRLIDGRPDQTRDYIIGCDISKGQGASNSVASILCSQTREKIGEWADANTPPYDFARIAVALGLWVGGTRGLAMLAWEANGPGWDFGRQVVHVMDYPLYYVDNVVGDSRERKSKRYGWHSSTEKKEIVLGEYRRALSQGDFINHSKEALDEATLYVRFDNGGIGPSSLVEENADARKTHGDRVIADSVALWALRDSPKNRVQDIQQGSYRTFEGRRQAHMKKLKDRKKNTKFDFRYGA